MTAVKVNWVAASLDPAREAARLAERKAATPPRVTGALPPTPPGLGPATADAPGPLSTAPAPDPPPVVQPTAWRFDVDPDTGALLAVHDPTQTRVVLATPNAEGTKP